MFSRFALYFHFLVSFRRNSYFSQPKCPPIRCRGFISFKLAALNRAVDGPTYGVGRGRGAPRIYRFGFRFCDCSAPPSTRNRKIKIRKKNCRPPPQHLCDTIRISCKCTGSIIAVDCPEYSCVHTLCDTTDILDSKVGFGSVFLFLVHSHT